MAINSPPQPQMIDPNELAEAVTNIAAQSHQLLTEFMRAHGVDMEASSDPFGLLPAFVELTASWASDPVKLLDAQFHAWQSYMQLWQHRNASVPPARTSDSSPRYNGLLNGATKSRASKAARIQSELFAA